MDWHYSDNWMISLYAHLNMMVYLCAQFEILSTKKEELHWQGKNGKHTQASKMDDLPLYHLRMNLYSVPNLTEIPSRIKENLWWQSKQLKGIQKAERWTISLHTHLCFMAYLCTKFDLNYLTFQFQWQGKNGKHAHGLADRQYSIMQVCIWWSTYVLLMYQFDCNHFNCVLVVITRQTH